MISPDRLEDIEVVAQNDDVDGPPFIDLVRVWLRHRYEGGRYSAAYKFDMVRGPFVDAVAVILYHVDSEGEIRVGLRRGVRPSIYLRKDIPAKAELDGTPRLIYLELVAGGIEYDDLQSIGVDGRAAVEVREEAGFEVNAEDMVSLGEGTFSAPGFGMEKLHYRAVEVNPLAATEPEGDGHPLEEVGDIQFYELCEALSWCRCGTIQDSKTEIGLYRLANYLGYHPEVKLWREELPPELQRRVRSLGLDPKSETRQSKGEK
ncbi:MAG: NUDIX hydrolase [Syntrophobacteria bacterium]